MDQENNNARLKIITIFANYLRLNLPEIHPFFKENKKFQSSLTLNLAKQKIFDEIDIEEDSSEISSNEFRSEMQEDVTPIKSPDNVQLSNGNLFENDEKDDKNKQKASFKKTKNNQIDVLKIKDDIKGNVESSKTKGSSASEVITKSFKSSEKRRKYGKSLKDHWKNFKNKFFQTKNGEKIKKYKKKVDY